MSGGFRSVAGPVVAVLASCTLLAGCSGMQREEAAQTEAPVVPAAPPSPPQRRASDAELLLSYFGQLRKLSGPDLAREHDAARQAYGGARSDYNRVRLAMVVSLANTPFHDEPRALDLLEPVAKGADSQLSGLAGLLVCQIEERRRLDASAQGLQQKLDALKSLERNMIERKR